MATKQGICTNCGSLVIFDDRDEVCECVFCHCVFPSAEAVELLANSEGHEFKNEVYEKQEGTKHYYSTPVMPDIVSKAVERDKVSKSNNKGDDLKLKPSEFELSPNDVKAPAKLVWILSISAVLIIGLIIGIALPIYYSRTNLKEEITAQISDVFEGNCDVNLDKNDAGYVYGYNVFGVTCQNIKVETEDEITEEQAQSMYEAYCALRADKGGYKSSDAVKMEVYTPTTIYTITSEGVSVSD